MNVDVRRVTMSWLWRRKGRSTLELNDRYGFVCDDGCRREAQVSTLWEQARRHGYGVRS